MRFQSVPGGLKKIPSIKHIEMSLIPFLTGYLASQLESNSLILQDDLMK